MDVSTAYLNSSVAQACESTRPQPFGVARAGLAATAPGTCGFASGPTSLLSGHPRSSQVRPVDGASDELRLGHTGLTVDPLEQRPLGSCEVDLGSFELVGHGGVFIHHAGSRSWSRGPIRPEARTGIRMNPGRIP